MYVDANRSHVSGGVYPTMQDRKNKKMVNDPRLQDDRTHACYIQTGLWKFVLFGVNVRLIKKLQMQNSSARLITRQRHCDHQHITPSLISLHWLPVRWRINYKMLLLTYHALHDLAPTYIVDMISPSTAGRRLRTADSHLLTVPRHDMDRSGRRGFSVTAPRLWNGLVDGVSP